MKDTEVIDGTELEELDFRYEITSYGADYPVDALMKRIKDNIIYVPNFQRKYVWNISQASKFIESLILGLPVPGVFLSRENKTGRLLIVDGQQRLMSLFHFYNGIFKKKEFVLTGLQSNLNGITYKELETNDRTRLDDSIIHATIVRQDEPDDEESSIYLIFERLNTGGKPLVPQEIRACIYYGDFNELLDTLKDNENWRKVFGNENERLKEQELILRFFALFYKRDKYEKPLKGFLNKFMAINRNLEKHSAKTLTKLFENTIQPFAEIFENKAFRMGRSFNAAIFDSMMVALADRLKRGPIDKDKLKAEYLILLEDQTYIANIKGGTSDEKNIEDRISLALDAFARI
jgi:uncharacterized protein with ParB-like and HNH nuclease domain